MVLAYERGHEPDDVRASCRISRPTSRRVAETYIHELGHQSGLLHQEDDPDCADDATLHIAKLMHPNGSVRRALTRLQWCKMRNSWYVTRRNLEPFTKAPELPDSGTTPAPTPAPPIPLDP